MKRNYQELYDYYYRHMQLPDKTNLYDLIRDLLADRPDRKMINETNYIISDATFYTDMHGMLTDDIRRFNDLINEDIIIKYCKDNFEYEYWARVFRESNWQYLNKDDISDKILFIEALLDKVEKEAINIISIFDFYHEKVEAPHNLRGESIDDVYQKKSVSVIENDKNDVKTDVANMDVIPGIKQEQLAEFFIPVFVEGKDYKIEDHATGQEQLSRFDVYCEKLESLLKDNVATTILGQVAYLTFNSEYLSLKYKNYKRTGKKVPFAPFMREYFDAIGKAVPKDTSPNKYAKDLDNLKVEFKCLSSKIR